MTTRLAKWAIVPVIAALASTPATISADDSSAALSVPASEFLPMRQYAISYEEPKEVAEFYVRTLGLPADAADYELARDPRYPSRRIAIATVGPIADPQVKAIQWRLELKAEQGGWETVKAGLRRKCQNGPNTTEWTRELCP